MGSRIAIVGATGAVGQEMLQVLAKRNFPIKNLRLFASPQSEGKILLFKENSIPIESLSPGCFRGLDVTFFCAGKGISSTFVPRAVEEGSLVIDSSSAFRLHSDVPLVIPEVNPHALEHHRGVIASPNCVASILLMPLAPLHKKFKIRRIVGATYQAASGAGFKAMQELQEETLALLQQKPYNRTIMPHPYAFNLFSHNAPMTPSGYNEEENKVLDETRKILEDGHLRMTMTCVRVPILRAHAMALNVEFNHPISPEMAKDILLSAPGVTLLEDWEQNRFPMPLDASGKDDVFVGRIRADISHPNTLEFWIVGDQLLKGAALNAVQIAEMLNCGLFQKPLDTVFALRPRVR